MAAKKQGKRRGFKLHEFVTSCSTCMGKEGLLNSVAKAKPKRPKTS